MFQHHFNFMFFCCGNIGGWDLWRLMILESYGQDRAIKIQPNKTCGKKGGPTIPQNNNKPLPKHTIVPKTWCLVELGLARPHHLSGIHWSRHLQGWKFSTNKVFGIHSSHLVTSSLELKVFYKRGWHRFEHIHLKSTNILFIDYYWFILRYISFPQKPLQND